MDVRKLQLPLQTVSLILGFAVWVILSSLMPFIKSDIPMTPGQLSWVTAVPVILGSVLRIPIGFWTNKYGARKLFAISFVLLLFPVYYVSQATTFVDLLIGGFFLGIGGAVFSVGVTSLPKYYPKEKHGSVNGLYGIGNLGTAVSAFGAPVIAGSIGWSATVQLYLILLAVFVLLHVFLGDRKEPKVVTPVREQMKEIYRNPRLWAISLFYFITFGCFVAFTIYLPNFLVSHFQLAKADAGFRTAMFIAIATAARPIGGWLGDKFNSFVILMFVFGGLTLSGILLSFSPDIQLYTVGCLLIAVCAGTGNGTIFKLVPLYFLKQAGLVNGIVSAMGGLGGFFPPLILASLLSLTGHYAIGFMALSEFALVSLVLVFWMYYQDRLRLATEIIENTAEAIIITDLKGTIRQVNPAFTKVTGYTQEEIIGENPRILKSGKQPSDFYAAMWKTIKEKGFWQGEIWNRRKNGDEYLQWLTISAIKNDAGEIKHYAGMFSDISELRNK
ncbi:nitrate/nitrite transporter [Paenibacillus elgii]|uniref:Nitrate/nitrite transporter n=1 Tax=Paenibacillus elgii TaxID=189691 RepID=A0A164AKR9_9BACL|nr:nitrate/nitrite transporter [Paenibacillus elgii]KZE84018.1 nitrate/nitrite transporter [Paenibacillus elgii]NEN81275.1 MFS transporter [Paenibacillus elgii]